MKKLISLVAGLMICLPSLAFAYNTTESFSATVTSALTDWSNNLTFQQFDSSLGTLDEVDLTLTSSLNTTLTVTNTASSASTGTANTEVQVSVTGANIGDAPQIDKVFGHYAYSLASGGSTTSGLLTASASNTTTYSDALDLSDFTGSGNIVLSAGTFTQTLLGNTGGNTSASQVTDADLTATITYDYTSETSSVPVPASLWLLGSGLAGLIGLKKRYLL